METFGEWLRQRRSALQLTRSAFAARVGCSVALLRKIEDGERRPSIQIAELMANSLNLPPTDHAMFVKVARGELSVEILTSSLKPIPAAPRPPTNLPIFPTPLIGRQHEVKELSQLLDEPHCHLLTLVGQGGIGKTRLAIETAAERQAVFTDGVYFVPLAGVNAARLIVPMIADAIGFAFSSAGRLDPKTQLFRYLHDKQVLLLLDNLEQLLAEPGIELLDELIASAPQVKLLVTSRESLRLQGEWVYEVLGLPVPQNQSVADSVQGTSIELFLQRARRAYVGFMVGPAEYPAIVRICRLVEGMPLGIELAAAWVRTLDCDEIAVEIERGLDFLSGSARDGPPRHRSMRTVFNHSWTLLTEEEKGVLLRLSVFQGGFRREAAEAVAEATLTVLFALVTKSLVRRIDMGRYELHELIRQFAAEHLAEDPENLAAIQALHSRYYLTLFSQTDSRLRSAAQPEALLELTAEINNFRSAWAWAIKHEEIGRMSQASMSLWYLFELRAWFNEGEIVFRNAAEIIQLRAEGSGKLDNTLTFVNAMRAHSAYFLFRLGNSVAAYVSLLQCTIQLQSSTDQFAGMYSLWYLGMVCWDLGKFAEANEYLQISLEKARACGVDWYQSFIGQFIGMIALDQGEYQQAFRYLSTALVGAREIGDPTLLAHTLSFLGLTILALGKPADAEKLLRESLALTQEIGYPWGIGNSLDGLGLHAQANNPKEAHTLFSASCDVFGEIGDLRSLSRVLSHKGNNSLVLGDIDAAQKSFVEVLRLAREGGFMSFALDALVGLALIWAKNSNADLALKLAFYVIHHPATTHDAKSRAEILRADLEPQLTRQQFEAARTWAQDTAFEDIVNEVLKQIGNG